MANNDMKVVLDGKEYSLDDFEGREIVETERAFGISLFGELDRGSGTGMYALIYMIKRREDRNLTPDAVLSYKLGRIEDMIGVKEENGGPPPKAKAKPKAGSTRE